MLVTASVVIALAYLGCVSVMSVVAALRAGGRREDAPDSYDALAASRLTMPVSVVVPVGMSERASQTLQGLLDLAYPEFEVIAVVEPAGEGMDALIAEWQLESREFFYRRTLETAPVRRIFRSLRDARLMVVEKDVDHRSDALNCSMIALHLMLFTSFGQPPSPRDRKYSIEHSSISTTATRPDGLGSNGRHCTTWSKIASSAELRDWAWLQSQASHATAPIASSG